MRLPFDRSRIERAYAVYPAEMHLPVLVDHRGLLVELVFLQSVGCVIAREASCLRVETREARCGRNPDVSVRALQHSVYHVVAEAVGVRIPPLLPLGPVECEQSVARPHPYRPVGGFHEAAYACVHALVGHVVAYYAPQLVVVYHRPVVCAHPQQSVPVEIQAAHPFAGIVADILQDSLGGRVDYGQPVAVRACIEDVFRGVVGQVDRLRSPQGCGISERPRHLSPFLHIKASEECRNPQGAAPVDGKGHYRVVGQGGVAAVVEAPRSVGAYVEQSVSVGPGPE